MEVGVIPGLATTAPGDVATAQGLVDESAVSVCSGDRRWRVVGSERKEVKAALEAW